jgi:glyoxylase-like metal-dependent hydrolase (beta-lactamase superfamily II)
MKMLLRVRPVGPWQANAHVLVCPAGRQSVLIDPAAEPRVLEALVDGTRCYPGHGAPFRLGDIRSAIESFISRDHGRFCGDATWGM